ncbi:MAG: hypothetical protein AAGB15_09905 [Pseudomonadota bacterium]
MARGLGISTACLLVAAALTACVPAPQNISISAAYDADQARAALTPGANQITGQAFLRQQGGGVVTCAGSEVSLLPHTDYAAERISALYGNTSKGYIDYGPLYAAPIVTPDPPAYVVNRKTAVCDAQGNFKFTDVSPGTYYVVVPVLWSVANARQGGSLMQKVVVAPNENPELILTT